MSYMVMECHPSYAVVLDRDGRFLKVANLRYTPGQTVTEVILMQVPEQKAGRRWLYSLSAVAACLVLLLGAALVWFQMPYASVYLTINPEVRIDVNRADRVVGLEGVNQDGKDLIAGYDYRRKDLDTVMDDLVDLAIEQEFLHPGGEINLSLDAQDENWVSTHTDTLHQQLNTYLTDKISVDIQMHTGVPVPGAYDSDYGNTGYDETDYGTADDPQPATVPASGDVTDYGRTDYGQTVYDPTSPYEEPDTPYDPTSPYEAPTSDYDDPDTGYDDPESDYDDPDTDYED